MKNICFFIFFFLLIDGLPLLAQQLQLECNVTSAPAANGIAPTEEEISNFNHAWAWIRFHSSSRVEEVWSLRHEEERLRNLLKQALEQVNTVKSQMTDSQQELDSLPKLAKQRNWDRKEIQTRKKMTSDTILFLKPQVENAEREAARIRDQLILKEQRELDLQDSTVTVNKESLSQTNLVTDVEIREVTKAEAIQNIVSKIKQRPQFVDCGLSDLELAAIYQYTGGDYKSINMALLYWDEEQDTHLKFFIQTMVNGLNKIKPYHGWVFRGFDVPSIQKNLYKVGNTVVNKNFLSASATEAYQNRDLFKISSWSGRYIAPLAFIPAEEEVLFPPNSRMRILNIGSTQDRSGEVTDKLSYEVVEIH